MEKWSKSWINGQILAYFMLERQNLIDLDDNWIKLRITLFFDHEEQKRSKWGFSYAAQGNLLVNLITANVY